MARYGSTPDIARLCGIYYCPDPTITRIRETWMQLSKVTANARICASSANITLSQTFIPPVSHDPGAKTPEATYSFPLHPFSSVVSFIARVKHNDVIVKSLTGIVEAKPQAIKKYNAALERGETAGYLARVADDVFTMRLGNLPQVQGTKIEVDVGYVTELKHDSEVDGIRFTIPTSIAPRFGQSPEELVTGGGLGQQVKNGLEMNVEIDMPSPVTGVESPSHPISVTIGSLGASPKNADFDPKHAFANLIQSATCLDQDFVLQVLCKDIAVPRAMLETYTTQDEKVDSAALMLTFVPKFVIPSAPGPKKTRKEVIFLVDRSGSMFDKIAPLKAALKVFVKSLPSDEGLRFDICSFGSSYSFLFDDSEKGESGSKLYSQSSLQTAMSYIDTVDANMGGTNIAGPIKEIVKRVLKRNQKHGEEDKYEWETELLLLTDGEVWNIEELFEFVRNHTHEWRSEGKTADGRAGLRLFTLGIGKDVSHALVEGLAKAGGGYSMTVRDNEVFTGKVVRMLKAALGERVGGYDLTFEGMENWKVDSSETVTPDDDFEMIDNPKSSTTQSTTQELPVPISLFDLSADPDSVHQADAKPKRATKLIPPVIICTPHVIPPLFPFNRTTVFLLLTPSSFSANLPLPEYITLKAITMSGIPLELKIPVTKVSSPGSKTLHQLAIKRYLDDLKEGESWIHSARGNREKLDCVHIEGGNARKSTIELHKPDSDDWNEDEFNDIVRGEGERVGVQWGVVGKWTAFVALEETSDGKKVQQQASPSPPPVSQFEDFLCGGSGAYALNCSAAGGFSPYSSLVSESASCALPPPPPPPRAPGASMGAWNIRATGSAGKARKIKLCSTPDAQPPLESPAPSPLESPISHADAVGRLINLQEFCGSWTLSNELLSGFWSKPAQPPKIDLARVKEISQNEVGGIPGGVDAVTKERVFATALVLVWMQERLQSEEETWELVVEKGLGWLRGAGVDVEVILAKAREILGIA